MQHSDLTSSNSDADVRFDFGEDWSNFSRTIRDDQNSESKVSLRRLLGVKTLDRKTFLDIGCGSGLHALAALQLGANRVVGFGFDEHAVETSKQVISRFWEESNWEVKRVDILEVSAQEFEKFDIIYSRGVVHHTWRHVGGHRKVSGVRKVRGVYAIALYPKTLIYGMWRRVKRTYSSSPRRT